MSPKTCSIRARSFGFRAAAGAVGIDFTVRSRPQFRQLLRVRHAGIGDRAASEPLAFGICFHRVLATAMHLGVLLRPARVHVLLRRLGGRLNPRLGPAARPSPSRKSQSVLASGTLSAIVQPANFWKLSRLLT